MYIEISKIKFLAINFEHSYLYNNESLCTIIATKHILVLILKYIKNIKTGIV